METPVVRREITVSAPDLVGLGNASGGDADAGADRIAIALRARQFKADPGAGWSSGFVKIGWLVNVIDNGPDAPAVVEVAEGSSPAAAYIQEPALVIIYQGEAAVAKVAE